MNTTKVTLRGLTPLLMHNGNLADPLHASTIALAKCTAKRKKTGDDHREIARVEWMGGLYVNEKGAPCLPGEVIEAALAEGARKTKRGKDAKAGILCEGDFALDYDGPKSAEKLWEHGGFVKRAGVRVQRARVIRTRPMFPEWSVKVAIQWDPLVIKDESDLLDIVADAGRSGICEWRPKFGRFEVG